MAKLLLCPGKESSKLALSVQPVVLPGEETRFESLPLSEDANRRRLQVEQRASRRKIVETRRRLGRELGTARDNRGGARVC